MCGSFIPSVTGSFAPFDETVKNKNNTNLNESVAAETQMQKSDCAPSSQCTHALFLICMVPVWLGLKVSSGRKSLGLGPNVRQGSEEPDWWGCRVTVNILSVKSKC